MASISTFMPGTTSSLIPIRVLHGRLSPIDGIGPEELGLTTTTPPAVPPDPDDAVFLLCCLDGKADYLISEDKDLLDLNTAYPSFAIGKCAALMGVLGVP